jgi:hypothetical protein
MNISTSLAIFLVLFGGIVFSAVIERTPEMMQKSIKHKMEASWDEYKQAFGKIIKYFEHISFF